MERLTVFPEEVRAVAAKELHYLLRSTTGKFNIVIVPIFVIVMALLVARDLDHSFLGLDRVSLVFVGLMIYASMFSNNFLFNAYAWEGAGVQSFFLSPVAPERIVFGKNVGVWIYNIILGVEGVIVFCLVSGAPPTIALIGGCLAFVAALLSATIVGNLRRALQRLDGRRGQTRQLVGGEEAGEMQGDLVAQGFADPLAHAPYIAQVIV